MWVQIVTASPYPLARGHLYNHYGRQTTAKAFAKDVFLNQEWKYQVWRWSHTVVVPIINYASWLRACSDVTELTVHWQCSSSTAYIYSYRHELGLAEPLIVYLILTALTFPLHQYYHSSCHFQWYTVNYHHLITGWATTITGWATTSLSYHHHWLSNQHPKAHLQTSQSIERHSRSLLQSVKNHCTLNQLLAL